MAERRGYILERVVAGRYVKLCAVDPETGEEAVVVGDAAAPPAALEQLAIRKLEQRLATL